MWLHGDRIFMTAIRWVDTCRTAFPPTQSYRAQHVSGDIVAKPEVERSASSAAAAQGQRHHRSLRRPTPPGSQCSTSVTRPTCLHLGKRASSNKHARPIPTHVFVPLSPVISGMPRGAQMCSCRVVSQADWVTTQPTASAAARLGRADHVPHCICTGAKRTPVH